ncbi:hypothetical protein [Acinetobacter wuhouensis]|uniref:Uncharacterized protein n=1 Tax=Acinetobacter wuhouensis TaxID=1879050 RepID=A0A4Q7ACX8_9GAMM|nr:hypothetical protein [Acinetobacter wuhouensis]RZG44052.1 hypothetical protein EXU28_15865 [Acinetobacter wuhouensis]
MFKKMLFISLLSLNSSLIFASDCLVSDLKTYSYEQEIQPRWELSVISKQRVYFHSAPEAVCKMVDDYLIQNDHVIAYSLYTDKAQEKWVYVMYINTEHDADDSDDLIEGWVKLKDFKKLDDYVAVAK